MIAAPYPYSTQHMIEVTEEAMDSAERWSSFEATHPPNGFILKLPGNRARAMDSTVVAVQQPPKEFGGFVDFVTSTWILSECFVD